VCWVLGAAAAVEPAHSILVARLCRKRVIHLGCSKTPVISELEAQESRAQQEMCANNLSIEYIDETLRPNLDCLRSNILCRLLPWRRTEYQNTIERFSEQFVFIGDTRALAMRSHNFEAEGSEPDGSWPTMWSSEKNLTGREMLIAS